MEPYFEAVRGGVPQHRAAALAGLSEDTIQRARRFAWFCGDEKRAEADCIQRRLELIRQSGEGGFVLSRRTTINQKAGTETTEETYAKPEWQANAWVLERRFPDDFAKREPEQAAQNVHFYVNGTQVNPV